MSVCNLIRQYLQRHDDGTVRTMAAALNLPIGVTGKACVRMAADGRLLRLDTDGPTVYSLGRLPDEQRRPMRGVKLDIQRQVERATAVAASIPGQTSEEFLAAGGHIERLPSLELAWTRYPRVGNVV